MDALLLASHHLQVTLTAQEKFIAVEEAVMPCSSRNTDKNNSAYAFSAETNVLLNFGICHQSNQHHGAHI